MRLAHPVIKEEPIRSDKPIGSDKSVLPGGRGEAAQAAGSGAGRGSVPKKIVCLNFGNRLTNIRRHCFLFSRDTYSRPLL